MTNAFEYGDALLAQPGDEENQPSSPKVESNQPYLNLATYVFISNLFLILTS